MPCIPRTEETPASLATKRPELTDDALLSTADALKDAAAATGTSIDHKIRTQLTKRRQASKSTDDDSEEDRLLPGEEEISDDGEGDDNGEGDDDDDDGRSMDDGSEEDHSEEDRSGEDRSEDQKGGHRRRKQDLGRRSQEAQNNRQNRDGFYESAPKNTKFSASSFADLGLSRPLIRACDALGYSKPTPIQAACIPLGLTGRDICGSAITGSGKTAAFTLPLLERLLHRDKRISATYVLILVPARELAVQVHSMIERLAQFTDIRAALVVGGLSLSAQAAALRTGPEIVVGTPGRVIDHLRNSQGFGLEDLATLVLDEADRLLEMGFKDEIHEIVKLTPAQRQTLLFSATMTEQVKDLIDLSLRHPVRLAADEAAAVPKALTQEVLRLKGKASLKKEATLLALVSRSFKDSGRVIIFFSTKQKAHRAKILFGLADLPLAVELHGDMTQAARLQSLEDFRTGKAGFLLATDVAARGLDILGVETVINFDAPRNLTSYLHRIGRTARAGSSGRSITFVEDGDRPLLKEAVKKGKISLLSRKVAPVAINDWQSKIEGFEKDVIQIHIAEREEKELRKAEQEAQKLQNMIEHRDEIYSRPARTWFQSQREKDSVKLVAKREALGLISNGGDGAQANVKKETKAAAKSQRRMEKKQIARGMEQREKRSGNSRALEEETQGMAKKVRFLKAKEQELRESGMSSTTAGRVAAAALGGGSKKGKQKERNNKKRELFEDTPTDTGKAPSKVYGGGAKSGAVKKPTAKLFGSELNKVKRGGKSKKSFKSKAKHKRR
jgi:ATP-dependent RNA helicase DDX27